MAQVLKEEIRKSILDSAIDVFVSEGFESSSMRQIAKGAGVTVGNLYRYFDNKEAMYDEIIRDVIHAVNKVLLDSTDGKLSFFHDFEGQNNPEIRRRVAEIILDGLNNLVPSLLNHHKKELIILLQSADKLRHHPKVFDLISWIGRNFDLVFDLKGAGDYVAISLIKGIEAIILEENEVEETKEKLKAFMSFITLRGEG